MSQMYLLLGSLELLGPEEGVAHLLHHALSVASSYPAFQLGQLVVLHSLQLLMVVCFLLQGGLGVAQEKKAEKGEGTDRPGSWDALGPVDGRFCLASSATREGSRT